MNAEMTTTSDDVSYNGLKIPAKIISIIFHPLFIPTFIFFWLLYRMPFEFAGITPMALFARKINVFWMTAFFPAFSVFLLWRLRFIQSIQLRTQRERIAPYMITMIFYWWMWYLSRSFTDQPAALKFFYFGIFLCTVVGLIANNFFKISMHAMGVGGALTCMLLCCFFYHNWYGSDVGIAAIITGMVCTSRLILKDHGNTEIYGGLAAGVLCQLIAYKAMM